MSSSSRPRTTKDDPAFLDNFFKQSRLHFIGAWKERYQDILASLPPPPASGPPPPPLDGERVLFHVDMDCFFAAVAAAGRPELAGKPIAVCHGTSHASSNAEISTCNYEARAYGVTKSMWLKEARRLCPNLVVRPYEFDRYTAAAEALYRCLFACTPFVAGLSCDEAILDVTGQCYPIDTPTSHQSSSGGNSIITAIATDLTTSNASAAAGSISPADDATGQGPVARAAALAAHLRSEIEQATQGCTCSIGIGPTKILARVALSGAKPNGTWHLSPLALAAAPFRNGDNYAKTSSSKHSSSGSSNSSKHSMNRANRLVTEALSRVRLEELPQVGAAALAKLAKLIEPESTTTARGNSQVAAGNGGGGSAEARAAAAKTAAKEARAAQKKLTIGDLLEAIGCGSSSALTGEHNANNAILRGQRALIQCLGDSKGRALWEMVHGRDPPAPSNDQRSGHSSSHSGSNSSLWGHSSSSSSGGSSGGGGKSDVDNRMFERQVARKSVSSQASWGVRFDTDAQVVVFLNQLGSAQAERMAKVGVKGKVVTLKVWRAVENAPDKFMKSSVGHGLCDNLARSLTLPVAIGEPQAIADAAAKIWHALGVPPTEVRGLGLAVSRLDNDHLLDSQDHLKRKGGVRAAGIAPAGQRSAFAAFQPSSTAMPSSAPFASSTSPTSSSSSSPSAAPSSPYSPSMFRPSQRKSPASSPAGTHHITDAFAAAATSPSSPEKDAALSRRDEGASTPKHSKCRRLVHLDDYMYDQDSNVTSKQSSVSGSAVINSPSSWRRCECVADVVSAVTPALSAAEEAFLHQCSNQPIHSSSVSSPLCHPPLPTSGLLFEATAAAHAAKKALTPAAAVLHRALGDLKAARDARLMAPQDPWIVEHQQELIGNACWEESAFAESFDDNPNDALAAVADLGSRWELLLPLESSQLQLDVIVKELPQLSVDLGMCAALSREWRIICKEGLC